MTILILTIKKHVPTKLIRVKPKDKPWYTTDLRRLKKKTIRLRKQAQSTQKDSAWERYRKIGNKLNSLIRQTKKEYPIKLDEKLKQDINNPKRWWRTVNNVMKDEHT